MTFDSKGTEQDDWTVDDGLEFDDYDVFDECEDDRPEYED